MIKTLKYELAGSVTEPSKLNLPAGAKVVSTDYVDGHFYIWATVNQRKPSIVRTFTIIATGVAMNEEDVRRYIGTVRIPEDKEYWHVWELDQ